MDVLLAATHGSLSVWQALVLGLTQGLTEFAPVSSSGHLILVPWLFNWDILQDPQLNKTFDVALHMGTLLGAVAYLWSDVVRYTKGWFRSIAHRSIQTLDERLAWFIVIATIPGAVAGAALESVIEDKLGQPVLIATMLAVGGVVLYAVDRACRADREIPDLTLRDSVIIGVAQAAALQPGVSRSGVTITAARALGMTRESAARFSFLLSLPIIAGAGLFKGAGVIKEGGLPPGFAAPFFWGFVAAAVSGYVVIWWLLAYLRRRDFALFMWYRLAVAALVFTLVATGVRPSGL
jgi:undecaprenyl-diphosphatase